MRKKKSESRHILIVDADKPFVNTISESLKKVGFRVTVVENHTDALERARSDYPDIILLSVELPDGPAEGYLICKDLKTDAELHSIPVIILSRKAREEDFERHRQLKTRADAYLRKPVTDEEIFAKIENLLGFEISHDDYSTLEAKLHAFMEEKHELEEKLREREREIIQLKSQLEQSRFEPEGFRQFLRQILEITTSLHEQAEKFLKELS